MKTIKFRFFATDTKRMISWEEAQKNGFRPNDFIEDDYWKPMQFTLLYDKKNKEIYEGDIVEENYKDPYTGEKIIYKIWELPELFHRTGECIFSPEYVEVIGNIYENADLLK